MKPALIFDMDGVLVDNNPFHKQAWDTFCKTHGHHLNEEGLRQNIYGKTNHDVVTFLFGNLPETDIKAYAEQKEALYRELFLPHLAPVPGLIEFLPLATQQFEKLAIASSAPPVNIDFILDHLQIRPYFSLIVDETMVSRGKPDPEVYLITSKRLGIPPEQCVVIEDSMAGIESAKRAGMKVVGITTTHSREELRAKNVDWTIENFVELSATLPQILDSFKLANPAV